VIDCRATMPGRTVHSRSNPNARLTAPSSAAEHDGRPRMGGMIRDLACTTQFAEETHGLQAIERLESEAP